MVNSIRQNLPADTKSGGRLLADNGAICRETLSLLAILLHYIAPFIFSFPPAREIEYFIVDIYNIPALSHIWDKPDLNNTELA